MLVARDTLTILFETDYYSMKHDTGLQAVVLTYKRSGTSDEFRQLHYKLLEVFNKVLTSKILVDTHALGVVAPNDQRWVGQYVIPQLAQKTPEKFLYAAVVTPEGVFTKLAVDAVEQISMKTGMCLNRNFDSMAAAKLWLSEQ